MAFNSTAFNREKFTPRTALVEVPELASYYGEESPVWAVRGLTGPELATVRAAGEKTSALNALAGALGGEAKEKLAAVQELFGLDHSLPADYERRIETLLAGSVEKIDRPTAVKLGSAFPVVLYKLTDEILSLSGLGQQPGKSNGSGATPASATH